MSSVSQTSQKRSTAIGRRAVAVALTPLQRRMQAQAKAAPVPPNLLAKITATADELLVLQRRHGKGTELLKQIETEMRRLQEQVLPGLMDEAGITLLGLKGDLQCERGEEVYASISKANANKAAQWLIDNGFGAIVKAVIKIEVERGDIKILTAARRALAAAKVGFIETSGVHPATLKAFVKEQLHKGKRLTKAITYHLQPQVLVAPAPKPRAKRGKAVLAG